MKKYLLFIGYLLSVTVMYLAVDFGCGKLLDKYILLDNDLTLKYAHQGGGGENMAILGASRAKHHYKPSVIENEIGITSFNYGMDGRNIFNQYVVVSEIFNNAAIRPEIVLLEIASIDIEGTPGWNGEKLSNLFALYKENEEVRELVDRVDYKNGITLKCINLYRYNSFLFDYIKNVLSEQKQEQFNGYVPLYSEWKEDADQYESDKSFSVNHDKELYLRKFIELCIAGNVKLIVINSPDYEIANSIPAWERKVEDICSEYEVTFINHAHDTLFLGHKEWFNEPIHLNDKGANIYSSIVAKELKDLIYYE